VRRLAERFSNRGRWGEQDERGALHFVTRDRVLAACALPHSGRVFPLALGSASADPRIATRWDAGQHPPHGEPAAAPAPAPPGGRGAQALVARAVLLDLPRLARLRWLEDGRAIGPEALDACAERSGVAIEPGDVLLVRTGQQARPGRERLPQSGGDGPAPGLSVHCARWLFEREIAAVASDTHCVEVTPSEVDGCALPLHAISLQQTGLLFGEYFALEELAEACAGDGRYAFLFAAPAGPPLLPLAVK
jgi:kynurenine formamidase